MKLKWIIFPFVVISSLSTQPGLSAILHTSSERAFVRNRNTALLDAAVFDKDADATLAIAWTSGVEPQREKQR